MRNTLILKDTAINMDHKISPSEPEEVTMEVTTLQLAVIGRHKFIVKELLQRAIR